MFDADTGALLWHASNSDANLNIAEMQYSIPSRISVIDRDNDGYADHMYVSDMGGQLFRMIHHSASDNVLAVLESVSQDKESGPVIRVGLARMYGINAEYSKSYYLFEGLLKQASLAPDVRALAIAYLIVTYSENQVFASNARLINTLSELIFSNQLEQLLPLHN